MKNRKEYVMKVTCPHCKERIVRKVILEEQAKNFAEKWYLRKCKRCDSIYTTEHRTSKICDKCKQESTRQRIEKFALEREIKNETGKSKKTTYTKLRSWKK
jgi:DNA-directed RNA polymerase beta' subunit